ncbi:hypothetical protein HNY73_000474 [Argiope bruennichi]|uniref:BZIP domain-containing protein n=1 Tax=Argiope bruennichi TaxID=94029 RepID=A0A8T0FY71_ARGBR|nr:hypothetical protein HNY73_000474 [Argiope bruennichi]
MASEKEDIGKESEFGHDDKEFEHKTVLCNPKCSNTSTLSESTSAAFTECNDLMHSDRLRTARHTDYDEMQRSEPKAKEESSDESLKHLYICKIDENKLDDGKNICSEQPLDFSKKAMASDQSDETPQKIQRIPLRTPVISHGFQENGANTSDSVDDSFDDEIKHTLFEVRTPTYSSGIYHSQSIRCEGRWGKLQKRKTEALSWPNINEGKSNGLSANNFSESEDDSNWNGYLKKIGNFERVDDHSQPELPHLAHLSAEEKVSLHLQRATNKMSHLPNGHSENGSMGKKDSFHIQDILKCNNYSARSEERLQPTPQIIDKEVTLRLSSKSPLSHFDREDSQPLMSTSLSPSHKMTLPTHRFPVGTNNISPESGGIFPSYVPAVFPQSHIANFVNSNSPGDVPGYSRLCSYPPGSILQPPFNPMYAQPYQQALQLGQNQQKQKNQRPFKSIDPAALLNLLPMSQTAAALSFGSSSSSVHCNPSNINYTDSTGTTTANSSPQRSPDSACLVNGSSGNSNESMSQDVNGEPSRKKIRRIPPEERDEKYLEKRKKNNIAAKKSRDERRKKEDILAMTCNTLLTTKVTLLTENELLKERLRVKEAKLDMIVAKLLSFREKCDGRTKEAFEEAFKFLLSHQ